MPNKTCLHKEFKWESGGIDEETYEQLPDILVEYLTFKDLNINTYMCTKCNEHFYYNKLNK